MSVGVEISSSLVAELRISPLSWPHSNVLPSAGRSCQTAILGVKVLMNATLFSSPLELEEKKLKTQITMVKFFLV